VNNFLLFAAAILFIPWLVEAQLQQRPALQQRHESPHEGLEAESLHTLEATKVPPQLETPLTPARRKNTLSINNGGSNRQINNDASAIATLAPANPAVGAPPIRRPSTSTTGLVSPHIARSLEDWEVEDFVLLATVDGKLFARDRKTGKEKWALEVDKPMVETTYHRRNRSSVDEDYDPVSIDDYLWIVEPSRDGNLYVFRPTGSDPGLINTGLTIKKLVEEMSPHESIDPPIVYNGKKETTLITIDARTGKVLKWFGSSSALVNDDSCLNKQGLVDTESEECSTSATLTIGRTEYTVGIYGSDAHEIATLKFSEWSPNSYDQDLYRQYHTTLDNKYIYTGHDGGVFGFDHDRNSENEPGRLFKHKFSSPVVRVFDVARPWGTEKKDPELIMLPQPIPPDQSEDEISLKHRASSIFLNQTEDGSWYAMSGKLYPLAVQGIGPAQCNQQGWQKSSQAWDDMDDDQFAKALVGLHSIDNVKVDPLLAIAAPIEEYQSDIPLSDNTPALLAEPTIIQRLRLLPVMAVNNILEFIKNPVLFLFLMAIVMAYQKQLRTWLDQVAGQRGLLKSMSSLSNVAPDATPEVAPLSVIPEDKAAEVILAPEAKPETVVVDIALSEITKSDSQTEPQEPNDNTDKQNPEPLGSEKPAEKEKKKAHRGRRGGVKHKKGRTTSEDSPAVPPTVDDAVRDAQNMGQETKLEPDIHTLSTDPSEVSGPIIRVGALVVNTEKLIGTGSNGTMVFEGSFDGREVAVKRMLMQFFDIASQETKLLRESDDHPNGKL
jgi:serine/threonine-protein kinase/endoribonuclease IRE1